MISYEARPSYANGYAQSAGESQHPELWPGMIGAWFPAFGFGYNGVWDLSGYGRTAVVFDLGSNQNWQATSVGPAIYYDGSNLGSFLGQDNLLLVGTSYTVVGWFKFDTVSGFDVIWGRYDYHWRMARNGTQLAWYHRNTGRFLGAGTAALNTWYGFAVRFNRRTLQEEGWVNGEQLLNVTEADVITDTVSSVAISSQGGGSFSGWFAGGAVWNTDLGSEACQLLSMQPFAPFIKRVALPVFAQPAAGVTTRAAIIGSGIIGG